MHLLPIASSSYGLSSAQYEKKSSYGKINNVLWNICANQPIAHSDTTVAPKRLGVVVLQGCRQQCTVALLCRHTDVLCAMCYVP